MAWAHMNAYLRSVRPGPPIGDLESSYHRLARAAAITQGPAPPTEPRHIVDRVLADRADPYGYCLRRCDSSKDPYVTLTTTLFDLRARTATVWTGDPIDTTGSASPGVVLRLDAL